MNIQAVAQLTGVPAATLRKWEQRYGVLKPQRTAGSHRRYSERDVTRVEWLKARLAEGYRIGEAARLIGDTAGRVPADAEDIVDELVSATGAREAARIVRALDQAFLLFPVEQAILGVAEPALKRIGELWEAGEVGVVDEHVLTELVRGKIRGLLDGGVAGTRGRAVLCCVPGERHEVGLLSLAVLMHADGWSVLYLGGDTPLADAVELADAREALLCVSATMAAPAEAAEAELAAAGERYPGVRVVRGGAAFGGEPAARAVPRLRRLAGEAPLVR